MTFKRNGALALESLDHAAQRESSKHGSPLVLTRRVVSGLLPLIDLPKGFGSPRKLLAKAKRRKEK